MHIDILVPGRQRIDGRTLLRQRTKQFIFSKSYHYIMAKNSWLELLAAGVFSAYAAGTALPCAAAERESIFSMPETKKEKTKKEETKNEKKTEPTITIPVDAAADVVKWSISLPADTTEDDKKTLEQLLRVRAVKIDDIKNWATLIHYGVPLDKLKQVKDEHVGQLAEHFGKKDWPRYFTTKFGTKQDFEDDALSFAERDPLYKEDAKTIQEHLHTRLKKQERAYRLGASYKEEPAQVKEISDKVILTIIKAHLDFLDKPESKAVLGRIMTLDREEGGIILAKEDGLEWVLTPNFETEKNKGHYYHDGDIHQYVRHISGFHGHPPHTPEKGEEPDSIARAYEFTGPSGNSIPSDAETGDIKALCEKWKNNKYDVEIVVSHMRGKTNDDGKTISGKCNVDIYCWKALEGKAAEQEQKRRQKEARKKGTPLPSRPTPLGYAIVIDAGIRDYERPAEQERPAAETPTKARSQEQTTAK